VRLGICNGDVRQFALDPKVAGGRETEWRIQAARKDTDQGWVTFGDIKDDRSAVPARIAMCLGPCFGEERLAPGLPCFARGLCPEYSCPRKRISSRGPAVRAVAV